MPKYFIYLLLLSFCSLARGQSYFPPLTGNVWDTIHPATYNIHQTAIDSALAFLSRNDTKAFIVLKDGKILHEHYFGTFTRDSNWYWASAGKTITAFAVGMAQNQGHLKIDSPTSRYLGPGWTSLTSGQEQQITVWHQLTMTSGLNDNVTDDNCSSPACLTYLATPASRWAYHNAPYTLLHDVVAAASSQGWQQYFNQQISARTGINGLWVNHVLFSRPRAMARFGLLMLNKGIWNGDTLLGDTAYLNAMTRPNQSINPAYGYLWWLNGQSSFMLPDVQAQIPGSLIPQAPAELVMGLGKNDQKLYLLPTSNIVIIRMGNGSGSEVPIVFDREFWPLLSPILPAASTSLADSLKEEELLLFPNPVATSSWLNLRLADGDFNFQWLHSTGRPLQKENPIVEQKIKSPQVAGLYLLKIVSRSGGQVYYRKIVVN